MRLNIYIGIFKLKKFNGETCTLFMKNVNLNQEIDENNKLILLNMLRYLNAW